MNMKDYGKGTIRLVFSQKVKPIVWFGYYRIYIPALCYYYRIKDSRDIKGGEFQRLPPPSLRYRVNGTPKIQVFLAQGRIRANGIEACLNTVGKELESFENVLDFACGCGRTIMWFEGKKVKFYGTDIDAEAIQWCQDNLKFARFTANGAIPPLEYEDSKFDLIYAVSVFTHLDENRQFQWLLELRRVLRPEGILIITVYNEKQELEGLDELQYRIKNDKIGKVPTWYRTSARSRKYVFDNYGKYFKIIKYNDQNLVDNESFVILQK
jgi:SAM-dependent methyltransferase